MRLPRVIGLILCDRLDYTQTGMVSLRGVVQSVAFPVFPTPARQLTVFSVLYDGVGEGLAELLVTRLETEADIVRYRRWLALPGRSRYVNLEVRLRGFSFPAPGRYALRLLFDQEEVSRRFLDVYST
jgi:hypothetical protein